MKHPNLIEGHIALSDLQQINFRRAAIAIREEVGFDIEGLYATSTVRALAEISVGRVFSAFDRPLDIAALSATEELAVVEGVADINGEETKFAAVIDYGRRGDQPVDIHILPEDARAQADLANEVLWPQLRAA